MAGGLGVVVGLVLSVWGVGAWRRFRQFRRLRAAGVKHAIGAPTTFVVRPDYAAGEILLNLVTDNPDVPTVGMSFGPGDAHALADLLSDTADQVKENVQS